MHGCCFFSSRRRHTRWNCDWSSDVCSSDLPTAAPRSSGRGSVFLSNLANPVGNLPVQLGGERTAPYASGVGLRDADDLEGGGREADVDKDAARERMRAGHIGVGSEGQVEQGPLRPLEEDDATVCLERAVDLLGDVSQGPRQSPSQVYIFLYDVLLCWSLALVDLPQQLSLRLEQGDDFPPEACLIHEVLEPGSGRSE